LVTDLDNTSRCPLGIRCECCGVEGDDLAVVTADLGGMGIACLTMCGRCADSAVSPPVAVGTAARLVMQHAMHLGITADEMKALRDGHRPYDRLTYRRSLRARSPHAGRGGLA
jgi:hypothetical protein